MDSHWTLTGLQLSNRRRCEGHVCFGMLHRAVDAKPLTLNPLQ